MRKVTSHGGLFVTGVLLIGIAGFALPMRVATPAEDALHVRELMLVGKDGARAARLACDEDGLPTLTFFDREGKERLVLGLTVHRFRHPAQPILLFRDSALRERAALTCFWDGNASLVLKNESGHKAAYIASFPPAIFVANSSSTFFVRPDDDDSYYAEIRDIKQDKRIWRAPARR